MGAPAVVIIPGASGLPKLYQGVIDAVKERGIENVQALHLLSVGLESGARPGPPPTMYDDAALIAEHVTKLADAGHDVVLVAHSYGGVPTTQSVKGLSKAARQEQGLPGGIVRIGYMTTLIPEQGQPAASLMALFPPENQVPMEVDESGWIYYTDVTRSAQLSFNDFPLEEGKAWASKLVKHSAASFATPLTYAGYKDVPVSYLLCTADLTIPVEIQQKEIDMIERETGKKVDVTSIKSDHVPPISHPQEVIDWIVNLAETK